MIRRVAFISEHASPLALLGGVDSGGQNVYVDQVARNLVHMGLEIDIYTRWENENQPPIVHYLPGIRIIHISAGPKKIIPKEGIFPFIEDFATTMIRYIREGSLCYELIHAHFFMSGYVALQVKRALDIPFIITFHALGKVRKIYQGSADKFPPERVKIEERVAAEADLVIAECPQDKEDLMVLYFVPEEKIKVIPCGFNRSEFYPINRKKAKKYVGLSSSEFILLQLGRMVPRKGVDNVIRSLGALVRKQPCPLRLLIVGGESEIPDPDLTPEIARLQQIAEEEKVLDKVTFTGRRSRDQLNYYYNAADLFITTPWYEPFGITPLEAMACGTPVVGSNVGGIKYSIDHGKTGFLVPANEPEILAERIHQILKNKSILKFFSLSSLERVNRFFTWEIVASEIAHLYEIVIRNRKEISRKFHPAFRGLLKHIGNRFTVVKTSLKPIDNKHYEYSKE